jgi:hypothetical protein
VVVVVRVGGRRPGGLAAARQAADQRRHLGGVLDPVGGGDEAGDEVDAGRGGE